jgi:hypothetical protein
MAFGGVVMAAHSPFQLRRLANAAALAVLAGPLILAAAGQDPQPAVPAVQIGDLKLPKLEKSPLAAPSPNDDAIQKLRKERYMAAYTVVDGALWGFQLGTVQGTVDRLADAHLQLLQAELDLAPSPANTVKTWGQAVEVAHFIDEVNETRFKNGRISIQDREESRYQLLDAKVHLREAKRGAQTPPAGPSGAQTGKPATATAEQPNTPQEPVPPLKPPPGGIEMAPPFKDSFAAAAAALKAVPRAGPAAGDDELAKLRKELYQSARRGLTARLDAFNDGTTQGTTEALLGCAIRQMLPAELALSDRPSDHLAAFEHALAVLKWIELVNDTRYRVGRISIQELEQTRFERLGMEIKILEAKRAAPAQPGR